VPVSMSMKKCLVIHLMCVRLQQWLISNESEHIFDVNSGVFHIKNFYVLLK
jgi:hypothetical protein